MRHALDFGAPRLPSRRSPKAASHLFCWSHVAAALSLLAFGCSTDPSSNAEPTPEPSPVVPDDAGPEVAEEPSGPITWTKCEVTDRDGSPIDAECADVAMPVFHGKSLVGDVTFPVHVTRVLANVKATEQLWLLNGGPGGDGASLASVAQGFRRSGWPIDFYLVDHRGTGKSNFLSCAGDDVAIDVATCGPELVTKWGKSLDGFSTTEAARDVINLAKRSEEAGKRPFVMGISYGTYWAHRILQIAPETFTGAILDGVCLGEDCRLDRVTDNVNDGLEEVLKACTKDATCTAKLGPEPMETARAFFAAPGELCGLPGDVRVTLTVQLARLDPLLVPAFVYRTKRCNEGDARLVMKLLDTIAMGAPGNAHASVKTTIAPPALPIWGTGGPGFSDALGLHIHASEMTTLPVPSETELKNRGAARLMEYPLTSLDWVTSWPRYAHDEFVNNWATIKKPLLLANGAFDLQTPISTMRRVAPRFEPSLVQTVEHPTAGHGMLFSSQCGYSMFRQFLKEPTKKIDATCLEKESTPNFNGEPSHALALFGTKDVWDGIPPQ
jgi:pimeloyl-ACP methyl ester carboxylesterase